MAMADAKLCKRRGESTRWIYVPWWLASVGGLLPTAPGK